MPRLCRGADSRRSALHTLPLRLPGESCPASNRRCKAVLNCVPHRYACGASTKSGKPETACALPAAPRTRTRTLGSVIRHAPPETMAVPLSPLPRRGSDPAAQPALANRPRPRHLALAPANHRPQDAPHVAREYGIGKSPRCFRKVRHSVCVCGHHASVPMTCFFVCLLCVRSCAAQPCQCASRAAKLGVCGRPGSRYCARGRTSFVAARCGPSHAHHAWLATQTLRKDIYFGQYGAILKMVVVNHSRGGGSVKPSASAYVTFAEEAGARACIRAIDGVSLSGRTIRCVPCTCFAQLATRPHRV